MKVCPFANSADVAGLPTGGVTYPPRTATAEQIYEAFWNQVLELAATDHKTIAIVLLITPRFALHSPAASMRRHPQHLPTTPNVERDSLSSSPRVCVPRRKGQIGADGAANYARRSLYPMINLLRTSRCASAEGAADGLGVHHQREQPRGGGRGQAVRGARVAELGRRLRARVRPHRDNVGERNVTLMCRLHEHALGHSEMVEKCLQRAPGCSSLVKYRPNVAWVSGRAAHLKL